MSTPLHPLGEWHRAPSQNGEPLHRAETDDTPIEPTPVLAEPLLVPEQYEERRSHARRRCLKAGRIVVVGTGKVYDCTVRNIGDGGMCLRLTGAIDPREKVKVTDLATSHTMSGAIAWQAGERFGVSWDRVEA